MFDDLILLSIALVDGKPPTEICMFRAGLNTSRKGAFLFDKAAAASVMAAYAQHGIKRLQLDYDHGMVQQIKVDPSKSGKSAGSWVPELRGTEDAPELWMTDIRWTKAAAEGVVAEEWNHFSPAFAYDKENRITRVVNCAITNLPALDNQAPLLAAGECFVAPDLVASLSMSLDDIRRGVRDTVCATYRTPTPNGDACDVWLEAVYQDSVVFSTKGKLWQQPYHFDGTTCVLDGTPVEVQITYTPVAPPEGSVTANQTNRPATAPQSGVAGKDGSTMDLIVKLGLVAGATEADAEAKLIALLGLEKDVLTLSGQPNLATALGTIQGWKASADKLPQVEAQLATLTAKAIETERDSLITANQAKISPAMLPWAKSQSIEGLKAFLAVAPDLVALNAASPAQPQVPAVTLTEDDKRVCKANNISEADFAARKAELLKEGA